MGRQYLRELLGWKEFDEIRELRRSIQLDTIYYSLVFAAEKGFPWPAVAEVGKLTAELLDDTRGKPGRVETFPPSPESEPGVEDRLGLQKVLGSVSSISSISS